MPQGDDEGRAARVASGRGNSPRLVGPRLVVPEGLLLDDVARDRLFRQLRRAPDDVAGVGAGLAEVPFGSSYRVDAEWAALEPLSAVEPDGAALRGAVVLRDGLRYSVRDGVVELVDGGTLLVDAGARVHDPAAPVGVPAVASNRGRPPFPRRPVVVFAACAASLEVAEWARRIANRLIRRDIEARLALPEAAPGLHLTRPCSPTDESIDALAPDVIVTLDDGARAAAPRWGGANRGTVVVDLVDDPSFTLALVPWQITNARGRLRARITRRVHAAAFAELLRRLCAGPQPAPPRTTATERVVVREHWGRRDAPVRNSLYVISGAVDGARVSGLLDSLSARGVLVGTGAPDDVVPGGARRADVVVVCGAANPSVEALVAERRAASRATVIDLGLDDLDDASAAPELRPDAARLAQASGLVSSPPGALHTAARALGVRAHVLPTVLPRARVAALRRAALARSLDGAPVDSIVWRVPPRAGRATAYLDDVATGLTAFLVDNGAVSAVVSGDTSWLPAVLRRSAQVELLDADAEPELLANSKLAIYTPAVVGGQVADDHCVFIESALAAVPAVVPFAARRVLLPYTAWELVVPDDGRAEAWQNAFQAAFTNEPRRELRAREAHRWARALNDPAGSAAVASRFLGWAMYEGNA